MIGTTEVEAGLYPGVKFEDYCEIRGVNFSSLRHFSKTPAHAYYEATHDKATAAKDFGHFVHSVILEPESIARDYLVAPQIDKRTKAGKAAWAKAEAEAGDRAIVKKDDYDRLRTIVANVKNHATIRTMLASKGHNELTAVWFDPEFEVWCKARLDRLCEFTLEGAHPQGYIVDIKTHGHPASTHSFQKAVEDYDYHEQMAFYRRGLEILRPLPDGAPERRSAWLVVESNPPNCVRLFDADDAALEIGQDEVAKHLSRYADCLKHDSWPGWDQGMEIAGLPAWAMKRYNVD